MNKELLKGTLNLIILLAISKKPMYGYEISNMIKSISNSDLIIKDSSLYTVLLRLENLNYLETFYSKDSNNKRKYYKITNSGLEFLRLNLIDFEIINSTLNKLMEASNYE